MKEYKFSVGIGDTVRAIVEDENHVVEFVDYEVKGVAQIGNKQYVFDECCEMYEIGSQLCLPKKLKQPKEILAELLEKTKRDKSRHHSMRRDKSEGELWERNLYALNCGLLGDPCDPETMLRYWNSQAAANYPGAKENVEYFSKICEEKI